MLIHTVRFSAELQKPRYVRVNTLKTDTESVKHELGQQFTVCSSN